MKMSSLEVSQGRNWSCVFIWEFTMQLLFISSDFVQNEVERESLESCFVMLFFFINCEIKYVVTVFVNYYLHLRKIKIMQKKPHFL